MRPFAASIRVTALVLALGLAGCAEIGEPDIGSPPTSVSAAETVPVDGTNPDGSSESTTPQLPPACPEGFEPSLLVATEAGVVLIPDGGSGSILNLSTGASGDEPGEALVEPLLAIDDYFRGLVVEVASGEIWWFQAEGGSARLVNPDGGSLLDVGFFNGTTEVAVATGSQIDRVRLADSQREPLLVVAPDAQLLDFSSGGRLYALAFSNAECGQLVFVNADGVEVSLSVPEQPSCEMPRRPFYGSVALSTDGGAVAYTKVSYRSDGIEAETALVVVDLSSGGVVFESIVGGSGDRVTGLSFDGQRVAMLREASNSEVSLVVVNDAEVLAGPDLARFGQILGVSWSRLPVAVGGES